MTTGYYNGGSTPGHPEMFRIGLAPWQQNQMLPPQNAFQPPPHFNAYAGYPPPPPVSHYRPPPPLQSHHNQYIGEQYAHSNHTTPVQLPYYQCYTPDSYGQQQAVEDSGYSFGSKQMWENNHNDILINNPQINPPKETSKSNNTKSFKVNNYKVEKENTAGETAVDGLTNNKSKRITISEQTMYVLTVNLKSLHQWTNNRNKLNLLFEIYGVLDSAVVPLNGISKRFKLRMGKDTIDCVFYEIDRDLGRVIRGHWLRCMGKLDVSGKYFSCVSVRPATVEEQNNHESLMGMCNEEMEILTATT